VLPERLAKSKVIVELEGEGDAVDLEGDAGAVGRFYSVDGGEELRLDLKGVVYEARMVPSATCLLVKLEAGEARVEAVMNEYMCLRKEAAAVADDSGMADGFAFGEDSERSAPSGGGGKRGRGGGSESGGGGGGGGGGSSSDDDSASGGKKPAAKKAKKAGAGKGGKGGKAGAGKKKGAGAKKAKPGAGAKRNKK
jgi:hypothetical protein